MSDGFLVRCTVCGREERTGGNPLRDGWPRCCGYTMRLEDNEAFCAAIDRQMREVFSPVHAAMRASQPSPRDEGEPAEEKAASG